MSVWHYSCFCTYQVFVSLVNTFSNLPGLDSKESVYLVEAAKVYAKFLYSDAHNSGNLLDPHFLDNGMTYKFRKEVKKK